jgi:hypothetical protein
MVSFRAEVPGVVIDDYPGHSLNVVRLVLLAVLARNAGDANGALHAVARTDESAVAAAALRPRYRQNAPERDETWFDQLTVAAVAPVMCRLRGGTR